MSHLLHEAVLRAARGTTGDTGAISVSELAISLPERPASVQDDSTWTTVHTPAVSPPTGPSRAASRTGSRATSPTPSGASTPGGGRMGARARREAAEREKKTSLDPLRRLPNELSSRIFELVGLGADGHGGNGGDISGVKDLLACGLVSTRWRRSATINHVWFKLCTNSTYDTSPESLFEPPTWRREDAKQDWRTRYRSINRRDDLNIADAAEAEAENSGYMTPKEQREAKWREEAEEQERGANKHEMRAYYKEMGGRKARGKTGKGQARDITGWDGY